MILQVKRLYPAGAMSPFNEPYKNMAEALDEYMKKNVFDGHNNAIVYMRKSLMDQSTDTFEKVGCVTKINPDTFDIDFEDNSVYKFIKDNIDIAIVRIVSKCTSPREEFGVVVDEIVRFELDLSSKFCEPMGEDVNDVTIDPKVNS